MTQEEKEQALKALQCAYLNCKKLTPEAEKLIIETIKKLKE